ncbi:MAG: serpin family protein [Actinomycetota bacterium]
MATDFDAVTAANRFTAEWAARQKPGSSVFSGVGAWVLLAALASGADGRARRELERAVGVAGADAAASVNAVFRALVKNPAVHAALAVWVQRDVPLERRWVRALPSGLVAALKGKPDVDQAAMDRWVVKATKGELLTLPVAVNRETLMVLASALVVHTRWVDTFTAYSPLFENGPWSGIATQGLHRVTAAIDQVRVVPTVVGPVSLLRVEGIDDVDVYLARGTDEAATRAVLRHAIEELAAPGESERALAEGEPGPGVKVAVVDSHVPGDFLIVETVAFDVAASHDLLDDPAFGLVAASEIVPGHFPGISTTPLAVGQARQDVTARFTEEGFAAAAVTAAAMPAGARMPPPQFRVRHVHVTFDRPFVFAAVHRPSGLVLVAGCVDTPTPAPSR